jgi:antirestriction protein ArdC
MICDLALQSDASFLIYSQASNPCFSWLIANSITFKSLNESRRARPALAHDPTRKNDLARSSHPFRPQETNIVLPVNRFPFGSCSCVKEPTFIHRKDKKMNSENIKKVTNQAIEQLIQDLNEGHSEALTRYLGAMAKFRAYSFLNVLLILKQCPNAGRVAGYKTWHSFGRQVKKGEKGIMILAPMYRKQLEKKEQSGEVEESRHVAGFRAVYVWDEQQTAGNDLPQIGSVTGDPNVYLGRLVEFVRKNGIALSYSDAIAPAKGRAEKGKITLLPSESPAETFATLVHEVAHSDMHFGDHRADTDKRIRETEAESVAYVVCSAIGMNPGTASRDYIGLYGGDAKLLLASLEYVQVTAAFILDALEAIPRENAA